MTIRIIPGTLRRVTSPGRQKITFETPDIREVDKLFERFTDKVKLVVEFKIFRRKRSLDANNYMWMLCDKIADATGEEKTDIYREAIRHVGVFDDVAVTTRGMASLIKGWNSHGIGYFTENFYSPLKGCRRVRLYHGSHNYDTKEMSRLIDYIVNEADNLGIETMTPDEIAHLKSTWEPKE